MREPTDLVEVVLGVEQHFVEPISFFAKVPTVSIRELEHCLGQISRCGKVEAFVVDDFPASLFPRVHQIVFRP